MQELFEKYTDDEIMKYFSILTVDGRRMRRVIEKLMFEVNEIDENTEKKVINVLFRTVKQVLPEEFTSDLDKCFCEGHNLDVNYSDMHMHTIFTQTCKLYNLYYGNNGAL